jgi:hypothetical protein
MAMRGWGLLLLAGACVGAAAASGMALMFDTSSDYVSIPPFALGGGPYSVEAWVRPPRVCFRRVVDSCTRARAHARASAADRRWFPARPSTAAAVIAHSD